MPQHDEPAETPETVAAGGAVRSVTSTHGLDRTVLETVLVHVPLGVSVLDRDLRFTIVNERAARINGLSAQQHLGRSVIDVLPGLAKSVVPLLRRVLDTGVTELDVDAVGPTPGRPGQRRWRGNYYPVYDDSSSDPVAVAVIFDEVSAPGDPQRIDQVVAHRAMNSTMLDALVDNAPIGLAVLDTDLRYQRINPILAEWNGLTVAEHLGRRLSEVLPDVAPSLEPPLRQLAETGGTVQGVELTTSGRTWLADFSAVPGPDGRTAGFAILVMDITDRRRTEQRALLLHQFTAALSQAASVAEVAHAVSTAGARAAGAKVAAVALLDSRSGTLRFVPTIDSPAEPAARWTAIATSAEHPVAAAFRSGKPAFYPAPPALVGPYPLLAGPQKETGDRAWAVVPLLVRGVPAGALTFAFATEQPFDTVQRDTILPVAGQAAQALARAQLFEREHETSVRLQRSLLPTRLPDIDGIAVATAYVTGDAAEVGGDFYDVFRTTTGDDDPRWVVVVGDVAGRGLDAATVTGIARHTMRVTAARDDPAEALRQLHVRLMDDPDVDRFVSVVCARLHHDGRGVTMEMASGGHPPALVRRRDGTVEMITVPGTILGAVRRVTLQPRTVHLAIGDTVVFYTDGVIEARGADSGLFGEQRLMDLLRDAPTADPHHLVEGIQHAVAAYQHGPAADDLAVLALHVTAQQATAVRHDDRTGAPKARVP